MGFIFDSMEAFFKSDGWPITRIGDNPAFSTTFRSKTQSWTCIAQAVQEENLFLFYSVCPKEAPEDLRPQVAEFLTYANYSLLVGNLEMSVEDGDIRFRTSLYLPDLPPEDLQNNGLLVKMVRNIVYANVMNMAYFLPGLEAVLAGKTLAESFAAIKSIPAPEPA